MEKTAERQSGFLIRSKLSWPRATAWAAVAALILVTRIEWRGCWFFRHGAMELVHFGFVFTWLVIFFALRMRWRLLLVVVTVPPVLLYFGLHGITEENAGPEAAAVASLRQIRSSLEAHRSEHEQQGYPISLPSGVLSPYAQRFYKYEYVPSRDASGKIVSYFVQATPKRRDCDFYVSFTITDEGKVFYTFEPRAATTTDKLLE